MVNQTDAVKVRSTKCATDEHDKMNVDQLDQPTILDCDSVTPSKTK